MKQSLRTNTIYNLVYQVTSVVLPLITAPYVSRVLGATGIGNISYTQAIFVYFNLLAAMGTGTYAQRLIAAERNSKQELTKSFWEIVKLKGTLVIVADILYAVFILAFGGDFRFLLCVQFADLFINAVDIAWLYQGLEDFQKTVSRQIVIRIVGVALIFIFVKRPGDEYKYLLCHSIPTIIGYGTMWIDVDTVVGKPQWDRINPFSHMKGVIALFIPYIATLLFSYVDRIMIGAMTSTTAEVGYYEQGNKFITISITLITSLSTVLLPRIATLYRTNKICEVRSYLNKAIRFVLCIGFLLSIGLFVVGQNLIPWYFGEDFVKAIPIMQVLSMLVVVKGVNSILGSGYLIASYQQTKYSIAIYISAITNIVLNAYFIPKYDALGAAITSVVSEFVLFFCMVYFSRSVLCLKELVGQNWKYVIATLVTFLSVIWSTKKLTASIIHTILLTIWITGEYSFLLVIMKDEFILNNFHKVIQKFKQYMKK